MVILPLSPNLVTSSLRAAGEAVQPVDKLSSASPVTSSVRLMGMK